MIYFDPHFQLPQIHQADLTVDQDLGWNTVLSVSWLGAFGRELPNFIDTNLPTPVPVTYTIVNSNPSASSALPNNAQYTSNLYGYAVNSAGKTSAGEILRPNGAYGAITDIVSNINSKYNALVVQVQHRLSHNIQFQSSYTWSHILDYNENNNTTFSNSSSVLDPRNFHLEYGNGNQNIPNRVIATAIINSPWKANGWKSYLVNGYEPSECDCRKHNFVHSRHHNRQRSHDQHAHAVSSQPLRCGHQLQQQHLHPATDPTWGAASVLELRSGEEARRVVLASP